ncbi:hypothetical protein [Chiayiivirga flava]|uniref:Uncharacterized protein n=1 Tax=Chiayiivirga flava TaxID=659595 RepID=A0A7W8D5N7_9GAMM|nr:hypothetical protein [Chiayiivirga flava]MBB5208379.1 hypothetical protein [Chiayiivirga flava]
MKKTTLAAAALLLAGTVVQTASALPLNWEPRGPGPVEPTYGIWEATVRYIAPHHAPDGTYHTYKYHHITATSNASCEAQLANWSGGLNVTVIEFCHWTGI